MFPFVSSTREVEIRPQHHWSRRARSVCAAAACASFQGVAWQRNAVRPSDCRSPLKPSDGQGRGRKEEGKEEGESELTSLEISGSKARTPRMRQGKGRKTLAIQD